MWRSVSNLNMNCVTARNIETGSVSWPSVYTRQQRASSWVQSAPIYFHRTHTRKNTLKECILSYSKALICVQQTDQTTPSVTSSHLCSSVALSSDPATTNWWNHTLGDVITLVLQCRSFFRSRTVSTVVINHRLGHEPLPSGKLGWTVFCGRNTVSYCILVMFFFSQFFCIHSYSD